MKACFFEGESREVAVGEVHERGGMVMSLLRSDYFYLSARAGRGVVFEVAGDEEMLDGSICCWVLGLLAPVLRSSSPLRRIVIQNLSRLVCGWNTPYHYGTMKP